MSSTSSDVCELWNGAGIVRVAGSPDFIELLYDQKQTDARLSEAETPDKENFGIYSRQNAMKDVAVDDPEHSQRVDTGAPNISLNTPGSEISPQELRIIALIAVVLQAAVIVFDGIVTYRYRWQKNNHDVPGYAFPMAAIGTVAVSVGMYICAHLIEASTRESTWQPIDKDRNLQVLWLQRGQTVNDQRFKSYGIYAASTQKVIRTSRPSSKRGDLEGLTYVGTAISIIGFTVQFIGLRGMHYSASLAQLVTTFIMTILRVLIRRSLTTEPYQCGRSQILSNLRNYSVQELPEGHELDFVAKQMVGCVHWNVVTYRQSPVAIDSDGDSTFDDDYTLNEAQLGRDYCRAISHVLSVRMRLSEVAESRWRTELHLTVETLKDTFDAVLNHVWNSAAAGGILPMKSDQELITWSVNIHAALVTTDNVEAGGNGFVEFRARRKKFDNGSRWTLWRTKEAVVEALFGLWMSQLQQHQPPVPETGDNLWLVNIDGLGGNNLGHVLCDWWISRDIDSIDVDHLNHIRNDYSIHPSRILNCITDGDTPSLAMQGIIGRSTLPQMCAQYILSAFLAAVLVAIKPITSETKFEPIKGKRHLKLINNDIQDLAERIEASGLASLDDAYRIVITALFRANKLPDILNNARAILQQSKRFSTSEIAEEGHFSGVCGRIRCLFSHKVDTLITQQSAWREAGEASRDLMRAFVEVMGPENQETALMRQSVGEVSKRLEIPQSSIVPLLPNLSDEPENFNITLDAIRNNQVNQIHHFLQHNNFFNLDDICDEGKTPLGLAASEGNIAFVRLFLFYGAKPTTYDANKQTPLHLAVDIASHGFDLTMVQIATLLLLNGANVNGVQEVQNWSPLDAAVSYGSNEIIQILIQNGADMNLRNEENMTALLWAVRNGRGEAVGLLLEKGAHLHAKDKDDKTALHLAAEMGNGNVLELLLAKGLGLHVADKIDKTALHWAAEGGHAACVELLITNGADVRSGDIDDKTALHWAAGEGHKAAVSALIAGGSDIDSTDRDGKTAMHWAAENGHKAAVRALIENGASLHSEDQGGRTALHWAARMGNETVVKLLVENRVDLDTKDLGGRTAMHWAALRGHAAVVSLLAREGADLHIEDLAGQTARKWAARRGHNAVVGLLMQTDQISSRRNSL